MKTTFVLILAVILLTGCATPAAPLERTPTSTSVPPSTQTSIPPKATLEPTPTPLPTPTPIPLGGGGNLILRISPLIKLADMKNNLKIYWISASSDGTVTQVYDYSIWSLSPDGKRALTISKDKKIYLSALDGSSSFLLDDTLQYYLSYAPTAAWLPNGDVILLAFAKNQPKNISAFVVNPNGEMKRWEELSKVMSNYAFMLFLSPDGKSLYWENEVCSGGRCKSSYYVSRLDDSEHKRILTNVLSAQDVHISPSGKYISFIDNSNQILRGCFLYDVVKDAVIKLLPEEDLRGQKYCFGGNHWSPVEDSLFGIDRTSYSVLNVTTGKIKNFPGVDAGSCYVANWSPDGKFVFLSICTKENSYQQYGMGAINGEDPNRFRDFIPSIGGRLIDISAGKVTDYPDGGFCNMSISPDSNWVLFFLCKDKSGEYTFPPELLSLETGEMTPILDKMVTAVFPESDPNNPDDFIVWSVSWLPNEKTDE
jgi:WD40 repeat protein